MTINSPSATWFSHARENNNIPSALRQDSNKVSKKWMLLSYSEGFCKRYGISRPHYTPKNCPNQSYYIYNCQESQTFIICGPIHWSTMKRFINCSWNYIIISEENARTILHMFYSRSTSEQNTFNSAHRTSQPTSLVLLPYLISLPGHPTQNDGSSCIQWERPMYYGGKCFSKTPITASAHPER